MNKSYMSLRGRFLAEAISCFRSKRLLRRPFGLLAMTALLSLPAFSQVRLGIDALEKNDFAELKNRHVALITNQTGVDADGDSTVDLLHKSKKFKLVCILTPEHGFRGKDEHGQSVGDSVDPVTGLPVYSLYGATTRPTAKMLKGVNTIVFDIQDIGTRFYTYITTMGMALEEAAQRKLRFVVLDRPNPIRGDLIDGDLLDPDIKRMTGYFPIPVRYGLTIGELAIWMNKTKNLGADVVVVAMKRWKRNMWLDQTGLDFIPPSPNIRSLNEALLYSGIGCFEATNVAVGRGTDTPFEIFGAPWIKARALCAYLREQNFPGVLFEPTQFTPGKDLYLGEPCEGVKMIVTSRSRIRPFQIFLQAFLYLHENHSKDFKPDWEEVRVVTGSNLLRDAAEGRITINELLEKIENNLARFREEITPFFLY